MSAATLVEPAPALTGPWSGVLIPYEVVGPTSKCHTVSCPFGLTLPARWTVVCVVELAPPVVAVGTSASAVPLVMRNAATVATRARMRMSDPLGFLARWSEHGSRGKGSLRRRLSL